MHKVKLAMPDYVYTSVQLSCIKKGFPNNKVRILQSISLMIWLQGTNPVISHWLTDDNIWTIVLINELLFERLRQPAQP